MKKIFLSFLVLSVAFYGCTPSVTIGTQTWMSNNLTTTYYKNGDPILEVESAESWANLTTGAWCYYNSDPSNETYYQKLYNWYALIDPRGLAPSGWHIPSDAEWTTLSNFLGGDNVAGGPLKESGTLRWKSPNAGATNSSGFKGFPGGYRDFDGKFHDIGSSGYWWSLPPVGTTNPWFRTLGYAIDGFFGFNMDKQTVGFSVRCVKD